MLYCSHADLHAFGIPRGATPNPGRTLADALDSVCYLDVHGFDDNDPVLLRPAGSGALPVELATGTTYYVLSLTEHTFQLRDAVDGAALTFTDAADAVIVIAPLPIADAIAWASRIIDDMLPAHIVPIDDDAVPDIVRMTAAELAAAKLLAVSGSATASLTATYDAAMKRLERWAKGVPIRGVNEPPPGNLAAVAVCPYSDRRGWRRWGGL